MQDINEQKKLRRYILGDLGEGSELLEVEERLIQDESYFQELAMVEEEIIQEYVGRKLSDDESAKFEKRFLVSEENSRRLKFAQAMDRVANSSESDFSNASDSVPSSVHRFQIPSPTVVVLGSVCIVVFLGLLIWQGFLFGGQSETLASLNKAFRAGRPIESRITEVDYASFDVTRGNTKDATDNIELELSKTLALKAVRDFPTAKNFHSLGRVYLAERKFDEAIEQFTKGLTLSLNNARLHGDLGVAWLEKGKLDDRNLKYLGNSIRELEKVIEIDKSLLEAYFNRALCLELMDVPDQARKAWRAYIEIDSSSKWTEEAKQKLKSLQLNKSQVRTSGDLIREFLDVHRNRDVKKAWKMLSRNRESVSGKLIPEQLAFSFSRTKKQQYLDALIYAGEIENKETGDSFWKDTAKFYSSASKDTILEMEKAHLLMQNGNKSYLDGKYDESLTDTQKATEIFSRFNNKWEENTAQYWIGFLYSVKVNYDKSTKILKSVESFCESKEYSWLAAHAQFWIGVNYGSQNKKNETFQQFEKAVANAESVSDFYNSQKILTETAEEYRQVGRTNLSLSLLQKSLAISHYPEASVRQKSRTLNALVGLFYSLKNYEAAIIYEKEAIQLLEEIEDLPFHQSSKLQLGKILLAKKDYDEALKVLTESEKMALAIGDKATQKDYAARSYLSIANLYREQGSHEKAIANYDKAIGFIDSSEHKVDEYLAHKGKMFTYLASKNGKKFEAELAAVLDLFEKHRKEILVEQNRNAFYDAEQSVYDIAIDFEYRRGNFKKAFNYSELSRSRSLLDILQNGAKLKNSNEKVDLKLNDVFTPLDVDTIRSQLPEQIQIVEYAVLKDKVLIWVLSKERFEVVSHNIAFEKLSRVTAEYLDLVSKPNVDQSDQRRRLAKELFEILVMPIADKLASDKTIAFVPDKFLSQLPFASFVSPETDKFLAEEHNLFFSPSTNVLLAISKRTSRIEGKASETILSIGNPKLDSKQYPELKPLLSAETEASRISHFYRTAKTLLGSKALKTVVQHNLSKYSVIHFAGHYVVNKKVPLFSQFVLSQNGKASDSQSSGLANYEFINEDLSHTNLVVLSACRSGIEGYYNGEGIIGAARSFLAARVPLVVASQWEVESKATSDLMIRFHRYRKQGGLSSINALRKAQIDLISGENEKYRNPYYWSAFAVFGGFSEF